MEKGILPGPAQDVIEFGCDEASFHGKPFIRPSTSCALKRRAALSLPLEGAFFPGVDKTDDDNENVSQHDNRGGLPHFFEDESPGEEKDDLDVKQKKNKGNEIELYGNRIDSFLKVRASALKRAFLYRSCPFRPQQFVHEKQDSSQKAENQEDKKKLNHRSLFLKA